MPGLEQKMTDLVETMFNYYKTEDFRSKPRGQFNIPYDEFCRKMVIFGLTPDEKSIIHIVKLCSSHFTKTDPLVEDASPPACVDLDSFKAIFLKQIGLKFVKLLMSLLKSQIQKFYEQK